MLGGAAKQVNAKKKKDDRWKEEQPHSGVVRGWTVRKVNSNQKNREEANVKFSNKQLDPTR
jgi:hypothetical protein